MADEEKIEQEGTVTDVIPGGKYRVKLDIGDLYVEGYPAGKIRKNKIKIIPGDRVLIELSPYDLTKGRISKRLPTAAQAAARAAAAAAAGDTPSSVN